MTPSTFAWYSGVVLYSILTIIFTLLLTKILRGSKNMWFSAIVILLLASNVSNDVILIAMGNNFDPSEWRKATLIVGFLCDSISNITFTVPHYLLGEKYSTIADTVPQLLDEIPLDPKNTTWNKLFYWSLLTLNIVFPIFLEIFALLINSKLALDETAAPIFILFDKIGLVLVGLIEIASGATLLYSVIKIRRYFKDREATAIDTTMLIRHAIAFGTYLVSVGFVVAANTLRIFFPHSAAVQGIANYVAIFYVFMSFISQLFLAHIFHAIEVKLQQPNQKKIEGRQDEEAELQATIWNIMVNSDGREDTIKFEIDPQVIR